MPQTLPFRIAVALGAFLLFIVQPLVARQILPWFGGAAAVWSTSMVFFQVALIAGYLYAHLGRRLGPGRQAAVHVALLVLGWGALPVLVSPAWKPEPAQPPALAVLVALSATVGVPFVLVAATAPLLQDWWRRVSASEPYWLYALSNAGSLAALFAYPVVVEPWLDVQAQATAWTVAYTAFVLVSAWAAWVLWRGVRTRPAHAGDRAARVVQWADVLVWTVLAASGSGLLLAVTNHICQDVAVVPLLWVLPLAVYLVTFIVTFAGVYPRVASRAAFAAGLLASGAVTLYSASVPAPWQVAAFLLLLAGGCLVCHGELVASRPPPALLTVFYLSVSAGGAVGGVFVALLAPVLFTWYVELPVLVLLMLMVMFLPPTSAVARRGPAFRAGLVATWLLPAVALVASSRMAARPTGGEGDRSLAASVRNFYGMLRVADHDDPALGRWRGFYHGRVLHGLQFQDASRREEPAAYFGPGTGVALAFEQHAARLEGRPLTAAVIGLGAGTIAAWGRAGDRIDFIEINPAVVDIARRHFTYLQDARAEIRTIIGDGRLVLERDQQGPSPRRYDVLVMDAFSGDSVPVHLLTRECLDVYRRSLAPSGVMVFHISNLFLDLRPVVRALAAEAGYEVVELRRSADPAAGIRPSEWMLMTGDAAFIRRAVTAGAGRAPAEPHLLWTDAYSSLVRVLR